MRNLPNIAAIARREFLVRVRTRSFIAGTVLLLIAVVAIAFVPLIVRGLEGTGGTRVAVWVGATDLSADPVPTLASLLNAANGGFEVVAAPDLAAARADVTAGRTADVVAIERPTPGGDLRFTLYSDDATTRTAQVIQQACTAIAVQDRLGRAGVTPGQQAGLFAPAVFKVAYPDPARTDAPKTSAEFGADYLLGFGMTILVYMMIILYGNWVAASVVEEKASRVMEVILTAATPLQLLAGKVIGVGALALTQYIALILAGVAAMAAQGPVATLIFGGGSAVVNLPSGLTLPTLGLLATFGILGFALYAALYAASASLVSRQEDLQQAVMPMTLISTAGYMIAVYSATGLLDLRAGWAGVLAQVPFLSPFLMLARYTAGLATPGELALAVAILLVSIVAALWLAARVYAVGVLLYGQRPSLRTVWRLLRQGM